MPKVQKRDEDTDVEEPDVQSEFIEKAEQISEGFEVYLGGPIMNAPDDGFGWRNQLVEDYPDIWFNNPLDFFDRDVVESISQPTFDTELNGDAPLIDSELVSEDKFFLAKSDALFVGLSDVPARGTSMEILFAYQRDIPVYVWLRDDQETLSNWLSHHAKFISHNRDETMQALLRQEK